MKAVNRHAVSMSSEEFIAPWRAVTTDNVNFKIGISQRGHQVVQEVEYSRIVLVNLAGAMVTQIMVQARQRVLIITLALAIAVDDVQTLSGMGVE
jgi:hypothetical protein